MLFRSREGTIATRGKSVKDGTQITDVATVIRVFVCRAPVPSYGRIRRFDKSPRRLSRLVTLRRCDKALQLFKAGVRVEPSLLRVSKLGGDCLVVLPERHQE